MASDSMYLATSWGSLIEDTLRLLYRNSDRPGAVFLASAISGVTNPATFTVTDPTQAVSAQSSISPGDILEIGQEQMYVSARSADAIPIFTVRRGWNGTPVTASGFPISTPLLINPSFPRYNIGASVIKCVRGPMTASNLYEITGFVTNPTSNQFFVNLPTDCIFPVRLAYRIVYTSGGVFPFTAFQDVSGWHYDTDLPTGADTRGLVTFPTGKIITLPPRLAIVGVNAPTSQVDLFISYARQFQWATGGNLPASEADTINLPVGGEDLPVLYSAAYEVSGRELSRLQVDRIEQWQQEASIRQGVSTAMVKQWWQMFYKHLEEAEQIRPHRTHRPYRKYRRM